jgi:acetoin utilization protein AcuC
MARYGFGNGHPFGPDRFDAFAQHLEAAGIEDRIVRCDAPPASSTQLARFHTTEHLTRVSTRCAGDTGFLDQGDTPALAGLDQTAAHVVGATLDAANRIARGEFRRAFVPIAGLHHAGRDHAAGFCVYNDIGVAIEVLRADHGLRRLAYVDIDVHHGDGVFYAFEDDPDLGFADIHQDGRTLYPGTGHITETGKGDATGTKLNLPLWPGADDANFANTWAQVEAYVEAFEPEMILFQCGADGLAGDPLAALCYTAASHAHAARSLCTLADRHAQGRLLAMGGGGYNRDNLAQAWVAVVEALLEPTT